MIRKMKAIYHTLNFFNVDLSGRCMIGECWVPVCELPNVQTLLADESAATGSTIKSFINVIHTNEMPPTYNKANKFTQGFQNLIDSYGMGSYREVNPGMSIKYTSNPASGLFEMCLVPRRRNRKSSLYTLNIYNIEQNLYRPRYYLYRSLVGGTNHGSTVLLWKTMQYHRSIFSRKFSLLYIPMIFHAT